MDGLLQEMLTNKKFFLGGNLNGHVGKDNRGYERVHGQAFGEKNELGDIILDFASAFELVIANTCFKKRAEHLITYKSGTSRSWIDFS